MALPGLTLPFTLPPFVSTDHSADLNDQYGDLVMRTGHARKRRVFTFAPRVYAVALDLSQEQATIFHEWYEGPLRAAGEVFSAQVQGIEPVGLLWYTARFVEPYQITPDITGRWRVTAKLLLIDAGSATGPDAAALAVEYSMALTGNATITITPQLAVEFIVALKQLEGLDAVDFTLPLQKASHGFLTLEGGTYYLLKEDGSKIDIGYGV